MQPVISGYSRMVIAGLRKWASPSPKKCVFMLLNGNLETPNGCLPWTRHQCCRRRRKRIFRTGSGNSKLDQDHNMRMRQSTSLNGRTNNAVSTQRWACGSIGTALRGWVPCENSVCNGLSMSLIHKLGCGIEGKAPSSNHGERGGGKKRDVTAATTDPRHPQPLPQLHHHPRRQQL